MITLAFQATALLAQDIFSWKHVLARSKNLNAIFSLNLKLQA